MKKYLFANSSGRNFDRMIIINEFLIIIILSKLRPLIESNYKFCDE